MKLFNKILFGAASIAVMGAFSSCKEEATLSGADAVFITMEQTDMNVVVGDTIRLTARVTNASGKTINTPIKWSVDNENIVKIVDIVETEEVPNPDYKAPEEDAEPGSPEVDPGEGADDDDQNVNPGEGGDTPESPEDEEGDVVAPAEGDDEGEGGENTQPGDNSNPEYLTVEHHYVGVVALPGSQGKSTFVRATLENGMFAMTTISVGRNALSNALSWDGNIKCSYISMPNDTIWFNISNLKLVDDYEFDYNIEIVDVVAEAENPNEAEFKYQAYETIFVDSALNRVGVIYTAPRMVGKANCTLTLGNDEQSVSATGQIVICPDISAGLETYIAGKLHRPGYGPETPSNIKPKQDNRPMDINQSEDIGVCLGVQSGRPDDIRNAMKADSAGYFSWSIEGTGAIVEELFYDEDYVSGFVSYIRVRSGSRSGDVRVTYSMPGQDFVCDIAISNYNVQYPVDDIKITRGDITYNEGDTCVAYLGETGSTFSLDVITDPEDSFQYHIPEVESSDESVVTVEERGTEDGTERRFHVHKEGFATLTFTSLGVVKKIVVEVRDKIVNIGWGDVTSSSIANGKSAEIRTNVYWSSAPTVAKPGFQGDVTWTCSDPTVLSLVPDPNDKTRATITALADGTATVSCQVEGFDMVITREFTVFTQSGMTFTNDMLDLDNSAYDKGYIYLVLASGDEYEFRADDATDYYGTFSFSGENVSVDLNADPLAQNMSCEYTAVDNGDGTATINGYFLSQDGIRYEFQNLTLQVW